MIPFFLGLLAGVALGVALMAVLYVSGQDEWP